MGFSRQEYWSGMPLPSIPTIYLFTYCLLTRLSSLSTCPSVCLPVGPSIIWVYLPIICLCTCLSVHLPSVSIIYIYLCAYHVYLPVYLSIYHLYYLFAYLSIISTYLSVYLFIYHLRKWQSTPALLPGKSHGCRSRIGYSPQGRKESDTTERLHFHFLHIYLPSLFACLSVYLLIYHLYLPLCYVYHLSLSTISLYPSPYRSLCLSHLSTHVSQISILVILFLWQTLTATLSPPLSGADPPARVWLSLQWSAGGRSVLNVHW